MWPDGTGDPARALSGPEDRTGRLCMVGAGSLGWFAPPHPHSVGVIPLCHRRRRTRQAGASCAARSRKLFSTSSSAARTSWDGGSDGSTPSSLARRRYVKTGRWRPWRPPEEPSTAIRLRCSSSRTEETTTAGLHRQHLSTSPALSCLVAPRACHLPYSSSRCLTLNLKCDVAANVCYWPKRFQFVCHLLAPWPRTS